MNTLSFLVSRENQAIANTTVNVAVLIDGSSPSGSLVDVAGVLFGSAVEKSSFFLYTCSCGHAGCEGFHIPLEHKRENGVIVWTIEDEKLSKVLGAERLAFDATAFDAACEALRAELAELEVQGLFAESMMDVDYDEDGNATNFGKTLEHTAEYARPFYASQQAMKNAIDAASDPQDPAPVKFAYDLDALDQTFLMPSVEAAARLLNLGYTIAPGEEDRVAALGVITSIVRDFTQDKDAEKAEQAYAPYRRFLREDELDEAGVPAFRIHNNEVLVVFPVR
jgi:hypothetical protein